jgi:hypothetical protein
MTALPFIMTPFGPRVVYPINNLINPTPIKGNNNEISSSAELESKLLEHINKRFKEIEDKIKNIPQNKTINIEELEKKLKDTLKKEMRDYIMSNCVSKDEFTVDKSRMEGLLSSNFQKLSQSISLINKELESLREQLRMLDNDYMRSITRINDYLVALFNQNVQIVEILNRHSDDIDHLYDLMQVTPDINFIGLLIQSINNNAFYITQNIMGRINEIIDRLEECCNDRGVARMRRQAIDLQDNLNEQPIAFRGNQQLLDLLRNISERRSIRPEIAPSEGTVRLTIPALPDLPTSMQNIPPIVLGPRPESRFRGIRINLPEGLLQSSNRLALPASTSTPSNRLALPASRSTPSNRLALPASTSTTSDRLALQNTPNIAVPIVPVVLTREQEATAARARARTEQEAASARAREEQEATAARARAREEREAAARARAEQEATAARARARAEQEATAARARAEQEATAARARARAEQEATAARARAEQEAAAARARAEQEAAARARAEQEAAARARAKQEAAARARAEQEAAAAREAAAREAAAREAAARAAEQEAVAAQAAARAAEQEAARAREASARAARAAAQAEAEQTAARVAAQAAARAAREAREEEARRQAERELQLIATTTKHSAEEARQQILAANRRREQALLPSNVSQIPVSIPTLEEVNEANEEEWIEVQRPRKNIKADARAAEQEAAAVARARAAEQEAAARASAERAAVARARAAEQEAARAREAERVAAERAAAERAAAEQAAKEARDKEAIRKAAREAREEESRNQAERELRLIATTTKHSAEEARQQRLAANRRREQALLPSNVSQMPVSIPKHEEINVPNEEKWREVQPNRKNMKAAAERAAREQREAAERAAREQREAAERAAREQREAAERAARERAAREREAARAAAEEASRARAEQAAREKILLQIQQLQTKVQERMAAFDEELHDFYQKNNVDREREMDIITKREQQLLMSRQLDQDRASQLNTEREGVKVKYDRIRDRKREEINVKKRKLQEETERQIATIQASKNKYIKMRGGGENNITSDNYVDLDQTLSETSDENKIAQESTNIFDNIVKNIRKLFKFDNKKIDY